MVTRTLTDANAIITISSPDVFPGQPVQLQGFSADDIYSTAEIEIAETMMGVDGILSAGYTPKPTIQRFMLQADSLSVDFWETIYTQQVQNQTVYELSGTTTLPAVQKRYTMSRGFLTTYAPLPEAKKVLQPRTFAITWNTVVPFVTN